MILFFYNLALLAALVAGAPWWLWKIATTHKYREGLGERLGRVPLFPDGRGRQVIWLHAVSVGEVLAVSRLVGELDRASRSSNCSSPQLRAPVRIWHGIDSGPSESSTAHSTCPGPFALT